MRAIGSESFRELTTIAFGGSAKRRQPGGLDTDGAKLSEQVANEATALPKKCGGFALRVVAGVSPALPRSFSQPTRCLYRKNPV